MASFISVCVTLLIAVSMMYGVAGSALGHRSRHRHERDAYVEDSVSDESTSSEDIEELFPGCPHCKTQKDMEEEELRLMRIEVFKEQLLDRLNLPFAPNTSFPAPPARLPAPLRRDMMLDEGHDIVHSSDSADDYHAKTTEVVVFATKSEYHNIVLLYSWHADYTITQLIFYIKNIIFY